MSEPEPPLLNSDAAPAVAPPIPRSPFQSTAVVFVFLRVCLYLALAYAITFVAIQLAFRLFVRGQSSYLEPPVLMSGELAQLAGAFLAAWSMSLLEKRNLGAYGLPLRGAFGKLFWQGALLGLIEISSVVGAMAALGAYHFGALSIHGRALLGWAAFWGAFFLVVGFYEEFFYRGYIQFASAQAIGFWPAAILLSSVFGFVHHSNPGENWSGVAGVVLTGLLWCFTLRRTGNLWFAVGMHASFDFGETFLYSVPDSGFIFPGHLSNAVIAGPTWLTGGSVGPEASVFDFLMLILFFFVIHWLFPPKPAAPPQSLPGASGI